jgi:hypothetical protein
MSLTVGAPVFTPSMGTVMMCMCSAPSSGMDRPTLAPSSRPHMPAQLTTYSAWISPRSVETPVTRPFSTLTSVTAVCSKMVTPPMRAPLARAWVRSTGLASPSPGM